MISKELLKEVLLEQKKRIEEARSKDFVIREKLDEIKKFVGIKNNIIITGVRRCGKSVFLSQIINNRIGPSNECKVPVEKGHTGIIMESQRLHADDLGIFRKRPHER